VKPDHIIDRGAHVLPPSHLFAASISGTEIPASALLRSPYRAWGKRIADILFTLMLAPVLAPVVGLLALLVMLDGGKPFYFQLCVGQDGRTYRMWKLRSMIPNAEAALTAYLAHNPKARAEWHTHQKLRRDPRITRIGHVLRAFSLDELPQFWNVILGDMSIVGPRPMMPDQVDLYPGLSYYALRPGITGPWQVSDRHVSTFVARAEYDDAYNASLSAVGDLGYILRTVAVMIRGTGC